MTEPLCIKIDGAWTALPLRSTEEMVVNGDGIAMSYEALEGLPAGEQEDFGAFRPDPLPATPEGSILTARTLGGDDRPEWVPTYGDAPAQVAPDNPTLGDWRVGLVLWKTKTGNRRDEVLAKIKDLLASGHPLGPVADERVNYSNNVLRAQLMILKDAVGFSTDDVEESLWRADRVVKGDLSGVWPLPAEAPLAA